MIDKENIRKMTEGLLAGSDKFLVDILIQPANRVSVYIDGDKGITIDDCKYISRSLEEMLNQGSDVFELNVSSPGLDRPLKMLRQYMKNIGRGIEIATVDGQKVEGTLSRVDDERLEIITITKEKKKETEQKNISILLSEIKTAKIKIDFRK
jgi:ribosome maturation factor RimP